MPSPTIDEKALDRMVRMLQKKPLTVGQVSERLDCTPRTIYRYLKILEERGEPVTRAGVGYPARYQVA